MPKGPNGEKRPADVIGNAVNVMRIATGKIQEKPYITPNKQRAIETGNLFGLAKSKKLSKKKKVKLQGLAQKLESEIRLFTLKKNIYTSPSVFD